MTNTNYNQKNIETQLELPGIGLESKTQTKPKRIGLVGKTVLGLALLGTVVGGTFLAREIHIRNNGSQCLREGTDEGIHQRKDGRFYNINGYEQIKTVNQGWVHVKRKDNAIYWGSCKVIKSEKGYFCVDPTPTQDGKYHIDGHLNDSDDYLTEIK